LLKQYARQFPNQSTPSKTIEEMAGKIWDAAIEWNRQHFDLNVKETAPDKEKFLNSLR